MPNSEKTSAAAASAAHAEHVDRFRWFIMLGLITAAMMEILDTTIINVALPRMAGNLSATQEEIAWVSTSYILANVVVLPMTAFFTEIFGRKRYLTFSILMFIAASFLCGTAHSLGQLILYRLMQGAGGAALLSTAQATLRQIFPKEEQGLVQAIFMLGVIVAPTLGPTLGGWITDNYDWKWCFFINVPVGLMSAFLVGTFLHDSPENLRHRNPVDWFGISLLIAGVGSLQYVLEEGNRRDWFADQLLVELAILSVVSLTLMVWWELSNRNKHPIIDFRVLHNRDLAASIFLFVVLGFGLFGGTFLFPLFTQGILGFKPTDTGMAMMPGGIATMFTALLCGKLLNGKRPLADTRLLIMIGMSLFAYAMWNLGHLTTAAGEADARYPLIIRGIALGFLFVPINNAAFGSIKPSEAQQASGLINLSRQLGGSFGIAILGAYLTRHIAYHRADLAMNTYVGNPAFDQRYQGAIQALIAHGTAAISAPEGAMALVQAGVMRQAAMLAYNDAWMLILISFLAVVPAVFLLRKPSARARIPMEAH
jgi:MFS transporter, DHA2 family, multidrug resistance protein